MKIFSPRLKCIGLFAAGVIAISSVWVSRGETQQKPFPLTHRTSPVNISSRDANGNQDTGCAAASFGAAAFALGTGHTRDQVIAHFKNVNDFATGLAALKAFLGTVNGKCYEITLMRINRWDGPFVGGPLPLPTVTTAGNTSLVTYQPFNFSRVNIAQAITSVGSRGGIIAGGVAYQNSQNPQGNWNWDAAHMVQITGININPNNSSPGAQPQDLRYNLQTYDPYYGTTRNIEYTVDAQGRSYGFFWGPMQAYSQNGWFHLEELLFVKEVPCPTPAPDVRPAPPTGGPGRCATGGQSCTVPANCGPNPAAYTCDNYCCNPVTPGGDTSEPALQLKF